jgi:hypothetical protein
MKFDEMTPAQMAVYAERVRLEEAIRISHKMIDISRIALRHLQDECKHDGGISWVQNASGNESCNVCHICGGGC